MHSHTRPTANQPVAPPEPFGMYGFEPPLGDRSYRVNDPGIVHGPGTHPVHEAVQRTEWHLSGGDWFTFVGDWDEASVAARRSGAGPFVIHVQAADGESALAKVALELNRRWPPEPDAEAPHALDDLGLIEGLTRVAVLRGAVDLDPCSSDTAVYL